MNCTELTRKLAMTALVLAACAWGLASPTLAHAGSSDPLGEMQYDGPAVDDDKTGEDDDDGGIQADPNDFTVDTWSRGSIGPVAGESGPAPQRGRFFASFLSWIFEIMARAQEQFRQVPGR